MPTLEITEIILVTLFPLSILAFIYAAIKRKDVLYYIPGFIALLITFISTNVEAIVDQDSLLPNIFNLFEHSFILGTALLLFLGAIIDAYFNFVRRKKIKKTVSISRKKIGGR